MADGANASQLGQELDVIVKNTSLQSASIVAGGSAYLPSDDFAGADADPEFWGFLQLTVGLE